MSYQAGAASSGPSSARQVKNEKPYNEPYVWQPPTKAIAAPASSAGVSSALQSALQGALNPSPNGTVTFAGNTFQSLEQAQRAGFGLPSARSAGTPPSTPAGQVSVPGIAAQAQTPATASQAPVITNFAANNPGLDAAVARYNARTDQQRGREGVVDPNLQKQVDRLGESLSTDETDRMVDRATSQARDQLAGIRSGAQSGIARSKGDNPYARGNLDSRLASAAARASAGAAANIQMGERARKDNLILGGQKIMSAPGEERLLREGRTDDLVRGGVSTALAPANLALDQQRLGLESWRAGDQSARDTARLGAEIEQGRVNTDLAKQRATMDQFQNLLRLAGY